MKLKEIVRWPADEQYQPRTAIFHIPRSSLLAEHYIPGVSRIEITESPEDIKKRLKRDYVTYRMFEAVRDLIVKTEVSDEV